jgi:hemerythrin-like domain-containing protein
MNRGTKLLNDDGTASMATLLMLSHHAFRRDLARFAVALDALAPGDGSRAETLAAEWKGFGEALHGHHLHEDNGIFPDLRSKEPALRAAIDALSADHRRIDPLLERGNEAFAALANPTAARAVVAELAALLDQHLAREEAEVVPHLRGFAQFPPPPNEALLGLYAQGFAWSMQGIAAEVLTQVTKMLPKGLVALLPDAKASFEARCERVWGKVRAGATLTSVPDA